MERKGEKNEKNVLHLAAAKQEKREGNKEERERGDGERQGGRGEGGGAAASGERRSPAIQSVGRFVDPQRLERLERLERVSSCLH